MSATRPFPAHVPTLTEVVEDTPIPEPRYADVSDIDLADAVAVEPVAPLVPAPQDIAVLTEVVPESEVLPSVDALLDDHASSDEARMVEVAESADLTADLGDDLTDQITEHVMSSMAPVLDQLAQQLVQDLQSELSHRLRHLVSQAVAQELSKRRPS
ncbi:hypothetical protein [Aquabacterium sp.]|uniref:hypothetical protein n=1 Tax=Aquabacterium sp. TaxID=1872578 RepID=UPI002E2EA9F8|nr:hypothetical protein [Aquabacterium sp.]HEX5311713.1 hypothetical protein [Aquabacterium sp.]